MSKGRNYATYSQRLASYQGWPRQYIEQTPESLAAAGFFYIGSADRVTCFDCHKTVRNWRPGQDPIQIHYKISPHCKFIKSLMPEKVNDGQTSSNVIRSDEYIEGAGCESASKHVVAIGETDIPMDKLKYVYQGHVEGSFHPDVEEITRYVRFTHMFDNVLNANCHDEETRNTITSSPSTTIKTGQSSANKKKDNSNKPSVKTSDIEEETKPNLVSENSAGSEDLVMRLRKENVVLKKQRVCKVCYKHEANVLVLPCSHIVFCSQCVESRLYCAKCNEKIIGTVKVFLA